MRWRTQVKPTPRIGDMREVLRFALLPTRLDDGFTVWLESYVARQTWRTFLGDMDWGERWTTLSTHRRLREGEAVEILDGARPSARHDEQCEHAWALGGLCYRDSDARLLGSSARARYYADWYYCTRCLARQYNNERRIGDNYMKPLDGATPR